jgi:predicted amidohydrolase
VNRELFSSMIQGAGRTDIFLLPEMFTTGFIHEPAGIAESVSGPTLEWMRETALATDAAVAGSVAVEDNGRFFNRFYFVSPDGAFRFYDKRHLFTMGGEKERFSAGSERLIFQYKGFRIMPLVCYDLRFPVFSRAAGQVDLMLYTASWPAPRIAAWDTLLRARAIENQCYVAAANRVGEDPFNNYNGHSAVIDHYGNTLAGSPDDDQGEAVIRAEISREDLDAFRAKVPAWMDADRFRLENS